MTIGASVERWDIFDLALAGPTAGNPFTDVVLSAEFSFKNRVVRADGFYDGDGVYRVRCMPDAAGEWRYVTHSNVASAGRRQRQLRLHRGLRRATTARWACATRITSPMPTARPTGRSAPPATPGRTRATSSKSRPWPRSRRRRSTSCACASSPSTTPTTPTSRSTTRLSAPPAAVGTSTRFNPAYFQHQEKRIGQLRDLGIEADLILFHPYDRWGFATMDAASDDRYLRYVVARLAAYRNVWWSMANEYDLMPNKTTADWDRFFRIVQEGDPYQHLRSIHNCREFFDHGKPWVTHCSVQRWNVEDTRLWREQYKKPVVLDECRYEGDIPQPWGSITAEEMVRRFWETAVRGGYCGHGETYLHPQDILWWSKGACLRGQSPARLAFLRRILEQGPASGHEPIDGVIEYRWPCAGQAGEYYLTYFGIHQPRQQDLSLPEGVILHGRDH